MPQFIAALVVPLLSSAGIVGAIGFTGVAVVSLAIGYAVTAAALYGAAALIGSATSQQQNRTAVPKPEDGKFNLRQAVPSLPYVLGRVKKGGDYLLLEERNGIAYHVLMHAGHQVNGYIEHWLHDEQVTLDANGFVIAPAHFNSKVRILTRLGLSAETAYEPVVMAFSEIWTTDHRGDGVATMMMSAETVASDVYNATFPQQMPQPVPVIEGALLYDPRTESTAYSTNVALFRLWHLCHPVGGKLRLADMYVPDWINAANVCDELVINRQGEVENRYHGGFWFRAETDPVQVGRLIDQAGELVVYERPDGLIGVHAGELVEPVVTLTETSITSISLDANRRQATSVLAVRGRFTDPEKGYNTVDAAIYGNPYIGEDTERTRTVANQVVQSHNHMARLQKITFTRANAPRVRVACHYDAGKLVPYQRFVRVHFPRRGLDNAIVELTGRPKLSLRSLTVEFEGIVVPNTLYDFTAAVDEGLPGQVVEIIEAEPVPVPLDFDISMEAEDVGGAPASYALATWTHVSDAFTYEFEWQPTAGGPVQSVRSVAPADEVRSSYLSDGVEYRFRLRTWSGETSSDWTSYIIETT